MKNLLSGSIEKLFSRLEENRILTAVRDGMILAIPWIMAGSFALLLKSLPIPAYKAFLETFLNGFFLNMLLLINDATLGIISLILLLTISLSFEKQTSTENLGLLPLISLCAYIAFAYNIETGFTFEIFQSTWLFNAVVVSIVTCLLYDKLSNLFSNTFKSYSEGADNHFNQAQNSRGAGRKRKLNSKDIELIKSYRAKGCTYAEIAENFGLSVGSVYNYCNH